MITVKKEVTKRKNQGFSYYFCLVLQGSGSDPIRIQETQKPMDLTDPDSDPQHWYEGSAISTVLHIM
jgi:hypothetical protein